MFRLKFAYKTLSFASLHHSWNNKRKTYIHIDIGFLSGSGLAGRLVNLETDALLSTPVGEGDDDDKNPVRSWSIVIFRQTHLDLKHHWFRVRCPCGVRKPIYVKLFWVCLQKVWCNENEFITFAKEKGIKWPSKRNGKNRDNPVG